MNPIALGLALATAQWNGTGEPMAVLCPEPVRGRCRAHVRRANRQRRALHAWRVHRRRATGPWQSWLRSTRWCESHGNYRTDTGNTFYGAYQFTYGTWRAVGGLGLPHRNPPLEQDYRAVVLVRTAGTGPWPVCG